jgi:fatty acid desaturase
MKIDDQMITQAEYAKTLRPFLPAKAFERDPSKILVLLLNIGVLIFGWAIASQLNNLPLYLLWLYLPIAVVMGNSVIVLLFTSHNIMHGSVIKNTRLIHFLSLLGLTMLWMPPTMWKAIHNQEHHSKTNSLADPDRNYLYQQPKTWGKWIQNLFVPSFAVNPIFLTVGMATAWGVHAFRNLTSVLLFNRGNAEYVPAAFSRNSKKRLAILGELLVMLSLHFCIIAFLQFSPLQLALGYFLPIGIGYAGLIFYIYTNHMLCRMTEINDPLINSISLRVPKIFDKLHLNFSYHTEHHIFPGINSDYYPLVQELIQTHYPGRMNLLDAGDAWNLLMETPRHYKDENTFTDWSGKNTVTCPLNQK